MKEVIEDYRAYLTLEELAEGTRSIYLREAKRFMEFIKDEEITKSVVLGYKAHKNKSGLKVETINLHLVALNKFLTYLGKEACRIKLNRVQKCRTLNKVMSKKEYQSLCDYAWQSGHIKYYYIMRTLAGTGIRISELEYFTVESIRQGVIMVRNKGKNRAVFVPRGMILELETYCREMQIQTGAIFRGNTEKPISRNAVFQMLKRMADQVGVAQDKIYPHSFRHLFAVTYMEKYHNLSELADILGHSSLETTRIYLMGTAEEKQEKLGALGLL